MRSTFARPTSCAATKTKRALGRSDSYWYAVISRRLGELYEGKGDKTSAAENYSKFLAVWSRADPEFQPIVASVKAADAQLKVEGR